MSNELLLSLSAVIAALISILYAARSNRIARRALSIAEEDLFSRKERLNLYLIEGVNYITSENQYVFAFNLSIINKATISNAIQRIDLLISFVRKDGSMGNIILQHDQSLREAIKGHDVTPFKNPIDIASRSAITNWCLFAYDSELSQLGRIDKYTLRITDAKNEMSEVSSYLIKEYRVV